MNLKHRRFLVGLIELNEPVSGVSITMLSSMAGRDFESSLDRHVD